MFINRKTNFSLSFLLYYSLGGNHFWHVMGESFDPPSRVRVSIVTGGHHLQHNVAFAAQRPINLREVALADLHIILFGTKKRKKATEKSDFQFQIQEISWTKTMTLLTR